MDARIVALFLFLCLSTGYTLKNDDIDDNIVDMLQETNKLKEAPEMVSFDASLIYIMFSSCSCFAFLGILHPKMPNLKSYVILIVLNRRTNYFDVSLKSKDKAST